MSDLVTVQGAVLSAMPVGEYDRRIVLLTRERGKISAFAKGARRQNSPLLAAASPFVFGRFSLYEGRSSYTLQSVQVSRQFIGLASLHPGIYYGYYFAEIADYFGREGTDEKAMLNLLYAAFSALSRTGASHRLIRCAYELRAMTEQGMMPRLFACTACGRQPGQGERWFFSQEEHGLVCSSCARRFSGRLYPLSYTAVYTMQYIVSVPMEKLFAFCVSQEALRELEKCTFAYLAANTDRQFRSLPILEAVNQETASD